MGLIFLILVPSVWAGNEIINYLTGEIYRDCQGDDIKVNPGLGIIRQTPEGNFSVTILRQPVSLPDLRRIIELIIQNEPYNIKANVFSEEGGKEGDNLLTCGNKELDANFNTYKWNGQRVDPFMYNINQIIQYIDNRINQINASGSGPISIGTGDYSQIQSQQWNISPVVAFSLGGITFSLGGLIVYLIVRERKKKKTESH